MIAVVCSDLFFRAKIEETARLLGIELVFCNSESGILSSLATGKIQKLLIDLNDCYLDTLPIVQRIQAIHPGIKIIGFLSHVQAELKEKALKTGFSMVVVRSEFSRNLTLYLKG